MKTIEDISKEIGEAVVALRSEVEKGDNQSKAKVVAIETKLTELDSAHSAQLTALKAAENTAKELGLKIEALDRVISSPEFKGNQGDEKKAYRNSNEYKALKAYLQYGDNGIAGLSELERKALRTDGNSEGGYLVPQVLVKEILKEVEEISPVRQQARVWTIPSKSIDIPARKSIPTALYEGEAETGPDSQSAYRSEKLTAHRQTFNTPITNDMLNFSEFNMESEIMSDAALAFAQGEGRLFLLGNGQKQPEGILVNADVASYDTATSAVLSLDDVIKLSGKLKVGYNPVYAFNRDTLVTLRTQKDSNGNYLWQIGGTTQPTQINGFDYILMQDMPLISAGTGSRVVVFGDFYRGYSIFDSLAMSIIRDNVTLKKKAMVEFTMHRYNDGQVVMAEAFKILKIKA